MLAIFGSRGRQIWQMPNGEIVCDMEQYKHDLEQIDVSKADKTKPERVLNSKEHTQFRGGVGSLGWFVDHCCHTVIISAGRTASETGVTDSSRFDETQQSDPRSEGGLRAKSRSEVFQWNIFASWVFKMRLMQILKDVRHSRVISFLQYMQASRVVAFLCLC